MPASLLLPMGRTGPAFLAYANFAAYTEWNNSLIYSTTAGYLATRIAGAAPMRQPSAPVAQLPFNEIKELQQLLVRAGFNVGKVDGVMGQQSRTAVKAMQVKYGLPADSWPTAELLARMRGRARRDSLGWQYRGRCNNGSPRDELNIPSRAAPFAAAQSLAIEDYSTTRKEHRMSFYDSTVPAFLQILGSLSGLLTKAEAHCKAKNIQPEVLLGARLYPDMCPLTGRSRPPAISPPRAARALTGSEVPSTPDTEKSFEELRQRIAKTIDYVKSFKPAQFDGADSQRRHFPDRSGQDHDDEGPAIPHPISRFPNFYFHAATAHGILRHNGVEIGKRDFLGRELTACRHSGARKARARNDEVAASTASRGASATTCPRPQRCEGGSNPACLANWIASLRSQ